MPERAWRTVTDISNDVVNPGDALARHANREGLAGRGLYSDERQEVMEGGNAAHGVFELLQEGKTVEAKDYEVAVRGFVRGILSWQNQFERKILETEVEVVAEKPRIKGRIDILRACTKPDHDCGGKGVVIVDGKMGKLVTYLPSHLQVGGYHYLWLYEERTAPICGREILCINAEGRFKVWPGLATPEQFLSAAIWQDYLVPLRQAVNEQRDKG